MAAKRTKGTMEYRTIFLTKAELNTLYKKIAISVYSQILNSLKKKK